MASLNFEELVRAAIIEGATRADAEARAREILFGDGDSDVRFLNDMDEALWQSCSRLEFENHWREMERVMKATGGGAEVILESMTELLDAGSISESQYEELLSRAWASGSSQAAGNSFSGQGGTGTSSDTQQQLLALRSPRQLMVKR